MDYSYLLFSLSIVLTSISPVFLKTFKQYFFINMLISVLSMFIISVILIKIKSYYEKDYIFEDKLNLAFKYDNIKLSLVSLLRFFLLQYGVINVPLLISVPLKKLSIITTLLFDRYLYNAHISSIMYYIFFGVLFGNLVMGGDILFKNEKNLKGQKSQNNTSLVIGIISLILSVFLIGYLVNKFKHIAEQEDELTVTCIQSGAASVIMLFLFFMLYFSNKINIPDFKSLFQMILGIVFILDFALLLKFSAFKQLSIEYSLILSQLGILLGSLIGIFYYNEKLTIIKGIGLVIVMLSSILGGFYLKK